MKLKARETWPFFLFNSPKLPLLIGVEGAVLSIYDDGI